MVTEIAAVSANKSSNSKSEMSVPYFLSKWPMVAFDHYDKISIVHHYSEVI